MLKTGIVFDWEAYTHLAHQKHVGRILQSGAQWVFPPQLSIGPLSFAQFLVGKEITRVVVLVAVGALLSILAISTPERAHVR